MGENKSDKIGNKTEKRWNLSVLSKLPYSIRECYFLWWTQNICLKIYS